MLLFIDNFDSFTYNLVQCFQIIGIELQVVRNQALSLADCLDLRPTHLVIGPGPGSPSQAGLSKSLMHACAGHLPILGVCLGHQAIAELYGGDVIRSAFPMHGKTSPIHHDGRGVFHGIPQAFHATRYHSLVVKKETLPECLEISAETPDGEIMGLRHRSCKMEGVQFHPESILTEYGLSLLRNFLDNRDGSL
ncbi:MULTISPECIES: aminodeoxychorismate/anthranilate synthase component II [Candidatus Protochlamydia]|uniref:anthranilate synthase component II n=1 Tax=Candidatus Protochlamydia naegleriophila TaxID=389348 RepID=UPI000509C52A